MSGVLQKGILFSVYCIMFCQNSYAGHEELADSFAFLLPLSAYGMTYYKDDELGRGSFYKSFGTTVFSTLVLKSAVNSSRPQDGPDAEKEDSFPSGHTSFAFSGASFLQRRYGWQFGAPAYLLASYVAWSRVETKHHHPKDVVFGAMLGTGISYLFVTKKVDVNVILGAGTLSVNMKI